VIGSTLSHYRIVRQLGKGLMGEVYATEDTKLGRMVALRILHGGTVTGQADLDQLAHEARAIAALNHPNIATVHSIETANGTPFVTMELVEGRPLADAFPRRGLPLARLLDIGIELADALGAAHQTGVIHRELKPANVLLTKAGRVKVLNFGLAGLKEAESTADYMSPEQARGEAIDHRSDIFSLGIVLYELATGERPFQGESSLEVLSAVMKERPALVSDVNDSMPASLSRVIGTCLEKDPQRRYQSARDVRNELRTLREEPASGGAVAGPAIRGTIGVSQRTLPAIAIAAAVALVIFAIWFIGTRERIVLKAMPISLAHTRLTALAGHEDHPSLSPDGQWFVYAASTAGNFDIYLQSVRGANPIQLTSDPADDIQPAFSADGSRIAFRSARDGGGIWIMGRTGEAARRLTNTGFSPAWSPDGKRIAYGTNLAMFPGESLGSTSALWTVDVASGETARLVQEDALDPAWSPGGKFIAYWGSSSEGASLEVRDLWVVPSEGGTPWRVTDDPAVDWCPVWSPDGAFLYFSSDRGGSYNLWRLPMDAESGRARGGLEALTTPSAFVSSPRISADGDRLVYSSWSVNAHIYRVSLDVERGVTTGVPAPITQGSDAWQSVDPGPDGRLALTTGYISREDLFIASADGSGLRQLTNDLFGDRTPRWSPDGRFVEFLSNRGGGFKVWTATPDGVLVQLSRAPRATSPTTEIDGSPVPIGRRTLYLTGNTIRLLEPASGRTVDLFTAAPGQTIGSPRPSHDGRTLYYSLLSTESDVWMVDITTR
jgi:Tol biopolymer transport system component